MPKRILAIETSCDETAISVIEEREQSFRVLSNIVSSQAKLHAAFGGVVPNLASREHQKNLVPILIGALKEAKLYRIKKEKLSNTSIHQCIEVLEREPELAQRFQKIFQIQKPALDAIAITVGPGLEPALWVGINFAKALSLLWNKPLIPVNHMEGHIFSALIAQKKEQRISKRSTLNALRYPALALLVSGGHTELVLMKKPGRYRVIGETLDDAAGEAFDKVAQMLKLGYPGGPAIAKLAERGSGTAISFPRPMINAANFNFSFSGLKTAVLYYLRDHGERHATRDMRQVKFKADIAASFQEAVVDVLIVKTLRALKTYQAQTLIVGGGVAANKRLRTRLRDALPKNINLFLPNPTLTGDNALMIAGAAFFNKQKSARAIRADGNMTLH